MAAPKPVTTNDPATVTGPDEQTRTQAILNNSAIFGTFLPQNRTDYLPLFGVIYSLQDYVAGKGNYDQLKSKVQNWAKSENYSDPINQAARANLIKILEGINDPDLKARAASALMVMKAKSSEVSGAVPVPKKEEKPAPDVVVPQKNAAKAVSPSPAGKGAQPKVGSTDLKKWREAKVERDEKLSDSAIDWSPDLSIKYPLVAYAIMQVREYVAGSENQIDFVRSKLLYLRRHPDYEKDPALKQTYQNLMKALGPDSLKAEYNREGAAQALAMMKELDSAVSGLKPEVPRPPAKPKEKKKPKEEVPPPVTPPAPVAPPSIPSSDPTVGELFSDAAIFKDQLSVWNEPSMKSGTCLPLNSALFTVRDFMDGKADYKKLKEKLKSWEGSACYQEPLSYVARTNLFSILGGVKEGSALSSKAQSVLVALKTTKTIEPPKVIEPPPPKVPVNPVPEAPKPTPAVAMKYVEFDAVPASKAPAKGTATVDSFKSSRLEIAKKEHIKIQSKSNKNFNFSGEVYVDIDAKGEIAKVTYKNVTMVRPGEVGENVTNAEATEFMKNLANAYRSEVKFEKVEKKKIGFKLELVAVPGGAAPAAPPPSAPVTPPPPAPSDAKSTYTFSFNSDHPSKLDRTDEASNANKALGRSMKASKAVFERYAKQDPSLSLKAKALIKVDPATGYVVEVKFQDVQPGGGMSEKIVQEILKAFADGVHANTRWKDSKESITYSIPILWAAKS